MAPMRQGRKIALVGASGNIGKPTLSTLLGHGIHTITVIARPESTTTYDPRVKVKKGSLEDETFLAQALEGQEVLVLQLPIPGLALQNGFIRAAANAGVRYILPTEWGSDPGAKLVDDFPLLAGKREPRRLIEQLGVSAWIAVVNNPWFDMSLAIGSWGIDIKTRKATLWEGGNSKINTATIERAGTTTAELLSLPEAELTTYRNRPFFVTSFYVTQREILASVLRATNTTAGDWDITEPSAGDIRAQCDELTKNGDQWGAFAVAFYFAHFVKGNGGDFHDRVADLKQQIPEEEDMDAVVSAVVAAL